MLADLAVRGWRPAGDQDWSRGGMQLIPDLLVPVPVLLRDLPWVPLGYWAINRNP